MANETEPATMVQAIGGWIILLVLIFLLGRCIFGGADNPNPSASVEKIPSALPANTAPSGSNILEQAILDAFPTSSPKSKAARKAASNAADYIGATINAAGYLCAKPIEAQRAATGQYGISCIKHRNGAGTANYLVDVRTGRVNEI